MTTAELTGKRKYEKPTEDQIDERVWAARDTLMRVRFRSEAKRHLMREFNVKARTAEEYLARARELILQEVSGARQMLKAESYSLYASIARDPEASHSDRIKAQSNIDKLLGLRDPVKIAATDSHGNDLPLTESQRREHIAAIMNEIGKGNYEFAEGPQTIEVSTN